MHYICNAQGDVVKLISSDGIVFAAYTYDAWGRVLTATENGNYNYAALNPLRYRGYYFDTETGFYYLQSRYYDPVVKRFLNADSYSSTGQGFLGYNMFAYCGNNPVNGDDSTGHSPSVMIADSGYASDEHKERYLTEAAKIKYNKKTVHVYSLNNSNLNGEDNVRDCVNISFSYTGDPKTTNIRIWDSYQIIDQYEMKAIIIVMMESELYNPEVFTHTAEEYYNEWQAHNNMYELCSKGHVSFLDEKIIEKAKHVDFGQNDLRWIWR